MGYRNIIFRNIQQYKALFQEKLYHWASWHSKNQNPIYSITIEVEDLNIRICGPYTFIKYAKPKDGKYRIKILNQDFHPNLY